MHFVILLVLALLSSVKGFCYSPMLHGLAPDVILPSVLSSEIYCPPPHVFDHFVCMCVDPGAVQVRVPTEGRISLELSLLNSQQVTSNPPFRLASPLAGLPDMHVPGRSHSSWPVVTPVELNSASSGSIPGRVEPSGSIPGRVEPSPNIPSRVAPVLNPYGSSFTLSAGNNKLAKDAGKMPVMKTSIASKQRELFEKARWQQQLQRETAVAVAELAASAAVVSAAASASVSAVPVSSSVGGESTLDLFMRDTLRRILYGY